MEPNLLENLVTTWVTHAKNSRASRTVPDETFWAWMALDRLCHEQPQDALEVILLILGAEQSEPVFHSLAAGPMEDLLAHHGNVIIERVEALARVDPRFRWLLGGVWQNKIASKIWARVEPAANCQ